MLLAGDEMNRTQGGNNNAYCQDNAISYLDWERAAGADARALIEFTGRLIGLRHRFESLRPSHYLHGEELRDGIADIAWFDQHGQPMTPEAWGEPEARTLIMRRAVMASDGTLELMLVLLNADGDPQEFRLPEPALDWTLLIDSARPGEPETPFPTFSARVSAHSVMLLTARA
jgi:glycogen operon protein